MKKSKPSLIVTSLVYERLSQTLFVEHGTTGRLQFSSLFKPTHVPYIEPTSNTHVHLQLILKARGLCLINTLKQIIGLVSHLLGGFVKDIVRSG